MRFEKKQVAFGRDLGIMNEFIHVLLKALIGHRSRHKLLFYSGLDQTHTQFPVFPFAKPLVKPTRSLQKSPRNRSVPETPDVLRPGLIGMIAMSQVDGPKATNEGLCSQAPRLILSNVNCAESRDLRNFRTIGMCGDVRGYQPWSAAHVIIQEEDQLALRRSPPCITRRGRTLIRL